MRQWPHNPSRMVNEAGTYIVTAKTYGGERYFAGDERLTCLHDQLLAVAEERQWTLEAWAVFENHYHFIGRTPNSEGGEVQRLAALLHGRTAVLVNRADGVSGRKVWHGYWQTRLTNPKSYLARLSYVMNNPVHHGLVDHPLDYPWCSAKWFYSGTERAWQETVFSFDTGQVNVPDDF